jgi:hypothetical protein
MYLLSCRELKYAYEEIFFLSLFLTQEVQIPMKNEFLFWKPQEDKRKRQASKRNNRKEMIILEEANEQRGMECVVSEKL